jgi:cysteinyl-tRNA synthetase
MRLYSTWHREKVELPPPPGPIRMYFCGPTVYQRIHVGNARPFVISMWLKRWLESRGYETVLVENITDINDKIYAAAPGASAQLADQATQWYVEDTDRLGLGRPDHEPRASETIREIVGLIDELVRRDLAYAAKGDVYFRVGGFDGYGRLAGRLGEEDVPLNPSVEEEAASLKDDPRDFALWKAHKPGEDTQWDSPWGPGRPGWHIECSAMAEKFLGSAFEIHGGGLDLVFPHHENEVAQSRGAGREFARMWMHNGMLRLAGEKMSKSIGNVISLEEALDRWGPETLLLYFMTAHWRKPMDLSDEVLLQARSQWLSFQGAFRVARADPIDAEWERLVAVLEDDFNTPDALALLHEWRSRGYWTLLDRGLRVFGLELPPMAGVGLDVERLRQERDDARVRRDWAEADRLREQIRERGMDVIDEPTGSRLVPK